MSDCYLCSRNVERDLTVRIDFGAGPVDVCVFCMEKADLGSEDVEDADAA